MSKRDRWDSSSEDEPEQSEKDDHSKRTNGELKLDDHRVHPLPPRVHHNPLLSGCRSVYTSYERLAHVDEGTYGVVWKARDLATDEIVALKQIKFDSDMVKNEGFPLAALREISVLLQLQHPNIVSVREMVVGSAPDKVFMVMEYFIMDLKEAMTLSHEPFTQSELKSMLHQVLSGTFHIHEKWLLHRDLKTSNILVHHTGRIALCDFGLARKYQDPLQPLTQMVCTLWYRPPELLLGERVYGPEVDMWSIGCIFGELINKDAIMQGQGELDQIDKIFKLVGIPNADNWPDHDKLPNAGIFRWKAQTTPQLAKTFPVNSPSGGQTFLDQNGFDLLTKLLTLNPKTRISADDALKHAYFQEGVKQQLPTFYFEDGKVKAGL